MIDKPLAGCRVLVTRPASQADELVQAIEDAGGEAIRFPVIAVTGRDSNEISREFAAMPVPDIVIFVSRNAVGYGLDAVRGCGARMAAIGPSTSAALEAAGIEVDIRHGDGFNSEQLLTHPDLQDLEGRRILIVRGERGRELLGATLGRRGAQIHYLAAYRRTLYRPSDAQVAALDAAWRRGQIDCVSVMSVETLQNLLAVLPPTALAALRKTPLVAPGKRVIQTASELVPGIPAITASGPTAADMVHALIEWRHSGTD